MTAADSAFVAACKARIEECEPLTSEGRLFAMSGNVLEVEGLEAGVGALCRVEGEAGDHFEAEIVAFR
ncbi:MAG: hypothetical protein MJE66_10510, partial [Proteobacteria bacterium]|nr:hypothetical protein [Pseudomonadota bacterium]